MGPKGKRSIKRLFAIVLVAAVICFVPFPIHINRAYDSIQWEAENRYVEEPCTIKVSGWYFRSLLGKSKFKGTVRLSCVEELNAHNAVEIALYRDPNYHGMVGNIWFYDNEQNKVRSLGQIILCGNFDKILYLSNDSKIVSAPANDRQSAIDVAVELTSEDFY